MKKLHLVALLGLFAAFCGFVFTSCGDDDSDPDNPLVGTWQYTESFSEQHYSHSVTFSITFKSNGEYSLSEEGRHKTENMEENFGSRESGTYTLVGNTLTLTAKKFSYKDPENGKWIDEDSPNFQPWSQEIAIDGKTLYIALWQGTNQVELKRK